MSILSLVDSVPQVTAALTEALKKGTSFGAPSLNENVLAKVMCASGRLLVWVVTWHPMSFVCVSCEVSHVWTEMCALQCQKRPTIVSKETYHALCPYLSLSTAHTYYAPAKGDTDKKTQSLGTLSLARSLSL